MSIGIFRLHERIKPVAVAHGGGTLSAGRICFDLSDGGLEPALQAIRDIIVCAYAGEQVAASRHACVEPTRTATRTSKMSPA